MNESLPTRIEVTSRPSTVYGGYRGIECLLRVANEDGTNLGNCIAIVSLGGPGGTDASPEAVREFAETLRDCYNARIKS